jgi:hypothetical protein
VAWLLLLIPLILVILILMPLTPVPDSEWSIEVNKSSRTLAIYQADVMRGRYSIALGGNPEGDKEFMGDQKTPIGEFRIVDKGPSVFHKWLGLNYPTSKDAYRGRYEGRLMWAEFFYLLIENRNGRIPYGDSALGGAIGIHGGGAGKDWTLAARVSNLPSPDSFIIVHADSEIPSEYDPILGRNFTIRLDKMPFVWLGPITHTGCWDAWLWTMETSTNSTTSFLSARGCGSAPSNLGKSTPPEPLKTSKILVIGNPLARPLDGKCGKPSIGNKVAGRFAPHAQSLEYRPMLLSGCNKHSSRMAQQRSRESQGLSQVRWVHVDARVGRDAQHRRQHLG